MKRINLCLGIHNHQPVGNFDFIFEEAYQKAYLPFLEVLEKHPHLRLALHGSGIWLEWIKDHKPDYIPRLRKLVQSGQVEMMTGAFYEPILAVIPDEDKLGQIHKLTQFVQKHTGYQATGLWLAERIWEPHLPKPLAQAGIKYVVLDDSHFRATGLPQEQLLGYFATEELSYTVNLFPISERLRYAIPFQEPEATIDYLRSLATEDGTRIIVFADDGEKFGIWPQTYKHCYEDKWLDRFFTALEQNREWINILHFAEVLQNFRPAGRVYLPTASYREMMEWAMPSEAIHRYEEFESSLRRANWFEPYKDFVRGGFWRNFMAKYPEINNMHKKMLLISRRLNRLAASDGRVKLQKAKDHLWASQCNCPYWHGVFGGAYLNNLRYANYHEMLQAEVIVDELEHTPAQRKNGWVEISQEDMDADNEPEVLISTKSLNVYVKPQHGGSIFELDYKPKAINLTDTMTRREEAYHRKLRNLRNHQAATEGVASIHDLVMTKEQGLENRLVYDWYQRASLLDHFLRLGTTLEAFAAARHGEQGDFVNQPFAVKIETKKQPPRVSLSRRGSVWVNDLAWPVEVRKTLRFDPLRPRLVIDYVVKNLHTEPVTLHFGTEFVFALLAGDSPERCYIFPGHELENCRLNSTGVVAGAERVEFVDEWLRLHLALDSPGAQSIWRFPIETISQSEAGFERVYQSSVIFPNWQLQLPGHGSWTNQLTLTIACE